MIATIIKCDNTTCRESKEIPYITLTSEPFTNNVVVLSDGWLAVREFDGEIVIRTKKAHHLDDKHYCSYQCANVGIAKMLKPGE